MRIDKRIVCNPPAIDTGVCSLLLSEKEASALLGVSLSFLRKSRSEGARPGRTEAPRFVRVGGRCLYRRTDLEAWVAALESRHAV